MRHLSGWFDEELAVDLAPFVQRRWHSRAARSLCEGTGLDDPLAAMQQMVAELVAESGLDRPGRSLKRLASHQDIYDIQSVSMPDAGRLIDTPDGLLIQVRKSDCVGRRNYTACHEVCHTLIPSYRDGSPEREDAKVGFYFAEEEEEYLCDMGASEMLFPLQAFRQAVREGVACHEPYLKLVEMLADEFCASLEATAIRLVRVSLPDSALIVWEPDSSSASSDQDSSTRIVTSVLSLPGLSTLHLRYACRSGKMKDFYFPPEMRLPISALMYKALQGDSIVEGYQELTTRQGIYRFWTESQCFPIRRKGVLHERVLTLVNLRQ